jgi:hypothetical protein
MEKVLGIEFAVRKLTLLIGSPNVATRKVLIEMF